MKLETLLAWVVGFAAVIVFVAAAIGWWDMERMRARREADGAKDRTNQVSILRPNATLNLDNPAVARAVAFIAERVRATDTASTTPAPDRPPRPASNISAPVPNKPP